MTRKKTTSASAAEPAAAELAAAPTAAPEPVTSEPAAAELAAAAAQSAIEAPLLAELQQTDATRSHISLDDLREQVENCRACPLADGRTQVVFGDGNPHARVLIIGEAPGKNEDLQGTPFVGKAGQGLNELLEIAGLKREDVFIANVLKCRPPDNRNPRVHEIQACADFLREQTRAINPESS